MHNSKYFICSYCRKKIPLGALGTKNRNHCSYCLYSVHIDNRIGDRKSICFGLMEPIAKIYKKDGEEVIVHKCLRCNQVRKNRVAGDDSFEAVEKLPVMDYF